MSFDTLFLNDLPLVVFTTILRVNMFKYKLSFSIHPRGDISTFPHPHPHLHPRGDISTFQKLNGKKKTIKIGIGDENPLFKV